MTIYEKISKVMADCGAIGKDSFNPQQKYKYRGIDAVMNALNPALCKNKVFVVPEVLETTREERQTKNGGALIYTICKVKYTFFSDDGSSVSCVVCGEGMDSGDKSMNKAMSAAFKYACFQTFCIPTDEMVDSEVDSPEVKYQEVQDIRHKKINKTKVEALKKVFEEKDIETSFICAAYKVEKLDDLTENQHLNIMAHLDKAKAGSDEWKAKAV